MSHYTVPKKGVFWVIGEELLAFPFDGTYSEGTSKSGDTYNQSCGNRFAQRDAINRITIFREGVWKSQD